MAEFEAYLVSVTSKPQNGGGTLTRVVLEANDLTTDWLVAQAHRVMLVDITEGASENGAPEVKPL